MSRGCGTNHSFRVKATAEGWPGIPLTGDVARVHFCSPQPTLSKTYKTSKSSRSVNPKRQLPDFPKSLPKLFKAVQNSNFNPSPNPNFNPTTAPAQTSTELCPWLSNSCGSTSSGWPKRNSTEPLRPSSSLGGLPPTFGS